MSPRLGDAVAEPGRGRLSERIVVRMAEQRGGVLRVVVP